VSSPKRLYHGSPHRLTTIEPRVATGKDGPDAQRNAVYMAETPEEATLYALTRPRVGRRGGWAIRDGKVHYVRNPSMPINRQGYVYGHDFQRGQYRDPPQDNVQIGYTVDQPFTPTVRTRVRLSRVMDRFVEHATKDELREFLHGTR